MVGYLGCCMGAAGGSDCRTRKGVVGRAMLLWLLPFPCPPAAFLVPHPHLRRQAWSNVSSGNGAPCLRPTVPCCDCSVLLRCPPPSMQARGQAAVALNVSARRAVAGSGRPAFLPHCSGSLAAEVLPWVSPDQVRPRPRVCLRVS